MDVLLKIRYMSARKKSLSLSSQKRGLSERHLLVPHLDTSSEVSEKELS